MSQLQIFEHSQFGKIRITDQNGEAWFVARDIAIALGYKQPHEAVRDHCKKVNKITIQAETARTAQDNPQPPLLVIPESDVYRLIMHSKLPDAEKFQDWVCEEVLPSIRKTGKYDMTQGKDTLPQRPLGEIIDSASKIFSFAGLDNNKIALACDRVHRSYTGKSALETAGIVLKAKTQEQRYNPTELGKLLEPEEKARRVNQMLKELGLQTHDDKNGKWILTDKGSLYGEYDEFNKEYTNGLKILTIRWFGKVLPVLQSYVDNN